MKKTNIYAKLASKAYELLISNKLSIENAWHKAGNDLGFKETIIKKGCPYKTFQGLIESGDLDGINATATSTSENYRKGKAGIKYWKANEKLTKVEVWNKVKKELNFDTSEQGQLDVVAGLWEYIKKNDS